MHSASLNQAMQRTYIAVVPAPGERHVTVRGGKVVGWIEINPADSGTISRHPGMGCIGADQSRLPWRCMSPKVSTDIACRQVQGTEAGNLKMRKILAHTSPFSKDLLGSRSDIRDFRVKAKVLVDTCGEIEKPLSHRPPGRKRLQ